MHIYVRVLYVRYYRLIQSMHEICTHLAEWADGCVGMCTTEMIHINCPYRETTVFFKALFLEYVKPHRLRTCIA